jgi:hypothetical protein
MIPNPFVRAHAMPACTSRTPGPAEVPAASQPCSPLRQPRLQLLSLGLPTLAVTQQLCHTPLLSWADITPLAVEGGQCCDLAADTLDLALPSGHTTAVMAPQAKGACRCWGWRQVHRCGPQRQLRGARRAQHDRLAPHRPGQSALGCRRQGRAAATARQEEDGSVRSGGSASEGG